MSKNTTSVTLRDLAGTGRGLGNMTVEEVQALLDEGHVAKVAKATKSARRQAAKTKKAPKQSAFYRDVIVGKRQEREAHQRANHEAAAWMREHGLVPSGQAWRAVKSGERGIKKLQALNLADGLAVLPIKGQEGKAKQQEAKAPLRERRATRTTTTPRATSKTETKPKTEAPDPVATLVAAGYTEEQAREVLNAR